MHTVEILKMIEKAASAAHSKKNIRALADVSYNIFMAKASSSEKEKTLYYGKAYGNCFEINERFLHDEKIINFLETKLDIAFRF